MLDIEQALTSVVEAKSLEDMQGAHAQIIMQLLASLSTIEVRKDRNLVNFDVSEDAIAGKTAHGQIRVFFLRIALVFGDRGSEGNHKKIGSM
jgi:hypothetical protein